MPSIMTRLCLALVLFAAVAGARMAPAQAQGQTFLDQDWVLNSGVSNISMQTEKLEGVVEKHKFTMIEGCLLYTSPSPRDRTRSRMPSSA